LVEVYVHFWGKYCLNFKGTRISQASNIHRTTLLFLVASHPWLGLGLLFDPEDTEAGTFLRYITELLPDYMVLHPRNPQSSSTLWNYSKCGVYTVESEAGY
jgi:hypothetical protein